MKLQKFTTIISELWLNVRRVTRLAFKIDRRLVTMYYITAAIGAIAPIGAIFLFKLVIDNLVINTKADAAATIPLVIVLVLAGYFIVALLETIMYRGLNMAYYDYLLRNRFQAGLTFRYAEKLSHLDMEHLENPKVQNLITQVETTYQWQIPDFVRIWNYLFSNLLSMIVASIALAPFGWWIPLLVLLITAPRIYFKAKHGDFAWSMFGGSAPDSKKLWYISDLLTNMQSILETRVFQSQNALLKRMDNLHANLYEVNKKPLDSYKWVLIIAPIAETLVVFGIVCMFVPQALSGLLSIGSITFIIITLGQLRDKTSGLANNLGELHQHSLFVNPYFQLMDLPKLIKEPPDAHKFKTVEPPRIELRNVSFTYPNGRKVLKDISFIIEPGESVALVGVNGAGKSTLIKLLCRFYDVTSGEILINGINIKNLSLSHWYSHLGTLFQDFVKYNFTVRDNIMLGAPEIKDEARMLKAAEQSGAVNFIEKFEKKYDQMLGRRFENGEELSGGQWQKLAIARAFYQQAPVLIMDEPTSAIDAESEFEIFENLEKVYINKSLILVSHRFSTVRNASKIIVIEHGQVTELGTHQELVKQGGKYATMFNAQAKGYK